MALTGYADQQGGLSQSSAGYPGTEFSHEGQDAIFGPTGSLPSGTAAWWPRTTASPSG